MAEGRSNASIAESLVLTKRAVEKHVGAIFQKLCLEDDEVVSRRVTAVLMYLSARQLTGAVHGRSRSPGGAPLARADAGAKIRRPVGAIGGPSREATVRPTDRWRDPSDDATGHAR